MALHPVSRVKLSTQIENQLKDQILAGKWKPGERLPSENELAEIFQVSRVSIRQALQALSAQGLIETRIGDGSFISQPSIGTFMQDVIPDVYLADDSLQAVLEFRRVFEGPVAELAATRATDEQISQLAVLYHQMWEYADDAGAVSAPARRSAFHMTPQKGGDGLGQLEFRLSGNSPGRRADEEHQTQQIALCQNGGGHGGGEGIQSLRDRNGPLVSAVLVNLAAFHDLFQLRCDALAHKLPLAAAGHGDDGVPVGDGADAAGGAAHGLTQLGGKVLHAAQQGIFFENHLAVPAGVDLQRVAVADNIGTKDLVRTHFCALDDGNG